MINRKIKILAIILVAVIALSIGFAAFSATLTIESQANVNPNASDFSVKFSKQQNTLDESDVNATSIIGVNVEAKAAKINNANSPTITGLNAIFTTPGSSVTYEFYVMNTGSYNAYLRNVNFSASVNGVDFISCKAGTGATPSLVEQACQGINFELTIGDEVYTPHDTEVNQELLKGTSKKVTVKISYETGSVLADGPFDVSIGNVALTYASTNPGVDLTPESPKEEEICFISDEAGELSYYICDGGEIELPTELPVSRILGIEYDEERCTNTSLYMGYDPSECDGVKSTFNSLSQEQKQNPSVIAELNAYGKITYEIVSDETYTITKIGDGSFWFARLEGELRIPDTVTTIETAAFSDNSISSLIISDSVISIGTGAFEENQISFLTLGNSVQSIEESAFRNNFITSVVIPDSVTTVGDYAFANNGLTTVELGTGISTLAGFEFKSRSDVEGYNLNAITSVSIKTLKSNFTSLNAHAFEWAAGSNCAQWAGETKDNPCIEWVNG